MLCVENVYVEVNMYVTLWSMIMMNHGAETSDGARSGWDRDTISSITRRCDIKNDFETVILTYKKAT